MGRTTTMLVLAVALSWGWLPPASAELLDPAPYEALLRVFVHAGKVDYAALAAHRADLDRFLDALAEVDPESGTDEEQTALWINVYNAGTLSLLLDHYPIRRSSFLGYLYPEDSIRHIADAWDRVQVRVGGTELTLNEIAHEILRKRFQEPRVLFALASGARSSPGLRGEAYVAAHLDEQLESATRAYLDDPERGFRIDPDRHTVWVSRLFLWFGRDFVPAHAEGPQAESGKFSETEAAVLHFIRARRPAEEQALLDGGDFALRYLRHDWRLNGQ